MTKQEIEENNRVLQAKIKDKDLKEILIQISRLSIPELTDFIEMNRQKKWKTQLEVKKKYGLSQE